MIHSKPFQVSIIELVGVLIISVLASLCALHVSENDHYSVQNWKIEEHPLTREFHVHSLIVDVRSTEEYAQGHIPGAISLDPSEWDSGFPAFLDLWTPDRPVFIYCGGSACSVSKEVALKLLSDLPDAVIYVLKGGFPAWKAIKEKPEVSS